MDERASRLDDEIVDQLAIPSQRLGPVAGRSGDKIRFLNLRHQLLQGASEEPSTPGATKLGESHPTVSCRQAPESRPPQRLKRIAKIE